jgi:DNA-binding transcriptional MerR regulator
VNRDRLGKLAADKRLVPGIYNYCDRWCERCPLTSRCLNFSISEEEFSDPEAQDIRNEAFWGKLSGILVETLELLRESAKKWGIELETLGSMDDIEDIKAKDVAAENHLLCRAARRYSELVEDWFRGRETLFLETAAAAREGVSLEEILEVIRWYQYFICAKVMRAVRGKIEEEEEKCDELASDSDGSAKIALIAIDRSIGAWAAIRQYITGGAEGVIDVIAFLDSLRQAVEKALPNARSFIRPGFDSMDLNG